MPRKPDFIGIGSPRCATTWLYKNLVTHPGVYFPPALKEVHFFDEIGRDGHFSERGRWNYERGISWYENLFNGASSAQIAGEITPTYLADEKAPELIAQHYPDVKLLLSVRNPIDRAYSHYRYMSKMVTLPESFELMLKDSQGFKIKEAGQYYTHLQRFLKHFHRDQILIIFYEDVVNGPWQVLRDICNFFQIDVQFDETLVGNTINPAVDVRSQRIHRLYYWSRRKLRRDLPGLLQFAEFIQLPRLGRFISRWNRRPGGNIEPILRRTRRELQEYYAEDICQLAKYTGRNLDQWLIS